MSNVTQNEIPKKQLKSKMSKKLKMISTSKLSELVNTNLSISRQGNTINCRLCKHSMYGQLTQKINKTFNDKEA